MEYESLSFIKKNKKLELLENIFEFHNIFEKAEKRIVYKANINTEIKKLISFLYTFEEFPVSQFMINNISGKINTDLVLNYLFTKKF